MAANIVMNVGIFLFAILFFFLIFVFIVSIISVFRRKKYEDYEPCTSIVIPCYNVEKTIARCLDSIFSLDYPKQKIEVIAVDDGSSDRTLGILKEFAKKHKTMTVVMGKHEGKSASLNLGLKKVHYDIVLTIDADTFIDKNSLKNLVKPFKDKKVGATNGSCIAENNDNLWGIFQRVEYHYNNLIRKAFSDLFNNGIWFFGAFACYRRNVLKKIGGFKKDTMSEDMDIALEIYRTGYKTINVHNALSRTIVPSTLKHLFSERMRWWVGVLQALKKNRALLTKKLNPSILFLFINQYWWTFYAFLSFLILAYQVCYWLPYNNQNLLALFMYLFRWFSLSGPIYVIYKIPEWGVNLYSIFGVLSGLISVILMVWAIYLFNDKLGIKNFIGVFFYFPYTIILNSIIALGIIRNIFLKREYFIYS